MFRLFAGMQFNSLEHQGIHDLRAALDHLAQQPGVDPSRLGAVGYCLGGGLAIALACTDNRLKAIAPYYGMNPRPLEAVQRSCPVVGSYPERDFTTGAGKALDMELISAALLTISRSTQVPNTPSSMTSAQRHTILRPRPTHGSASWPFSMSTSGELLRRTCPCPGRSIHPAPRSDSRSNTW